MPDNNLVPPPVATVAPPFLVGYDPNVGLVLVPNQQTGPAIIPSGGNGGRAGVRRTLGRSATVRCPESLTFNRFGQLTSFVDGECCCPICLQLCLLYDVTTDVDVQELIDNFNLVEGDCIALLAQTVTSENPTGIYCVELVNEELVLVLSTTETLDKGKILLCEDSGLLYLICEDDPLEICLIGGQPIVTALGIVDLITDPATTLVAGADFQLVTLAAGDIVLLQGQNPATDNGLWVVQPGGADATQLDVCVNGLTYQVAEGTFAGLVLLGIEVSPLVLTFALIVNPLMSSIVEAFTAGVTNLVPWTDTAETNTLDSTTEAVFGRAGVLMSITMQSDDAAIPLDANGLEVLVNGASALVIAAPGTIPADAGDVVLKVDLFVPFGAADRIAIRLISTGTLVAQSVRICTEVALAV